MNETQKAELLKSVTDAITVIIGWVSDIEQDACEIDLRAFVEWMNRPQGE